MIDLVPKLLALCSTLQRRPLLSASQAIPVTTVTTRRIGPAPKRSSGHLLDLCVSRHACLPYSAIPAALAQPDTRQAQATEIPK